MKMLFRVAVLFIALIFLSSLFAFIILQIPDSETFYNEIYIEDTPGYVFTYTNELNAFSNETYSRPLNRYARVLNSHYQPISIGFKESLEKFIFPRKFFKTKCPSSSQDYNKIKPEICNGKGPKKFYQSSAKTPQVQGNSNLKFTLETTESVIEKTGEFLFVECAKNKKNIWLSNNYNETSVARAKIIENKIKANMKLSEVRPLSVVLLVFDSASRQGFYRNMKEFISFMNESIIANNSEFSEDFVVYDFLGSNSNSRNTVPNMATLLFGQSRESIFDILKEEYLSNQEYQQLYIEFQMKHSLWSYFRDNGFLTMVSIDSVHDFISKLTGRTLLADHTTASFWKLCAQFYYYDEFQNKAICLGNKLPHQHSLDYLSLYLKNYIGHSRFSYTHINLAHEHGGMRLFEADLDMKNFLIKNLNMYKNLDEDVVFFIMGDHGKSKRDTIYLDSDGELLLPVSFVIANKKFINEHKLHKATDINTSRLLSRYDWHKTIKALAHAPYTNLNNSIVDVETEYPSIFIFNEVSPIERTCKSVGIPISYCLSKSFIRISLKDWEKNDRLSFYIHESIASINSHVNKNVGTTCGDISLGSLFYIKKLSINRFEEYPADHFLILYSLNNNENSRFFVHAAYSKTDLGISFKLPDGLSREKQSVKEISPKRKEIIINKIWTIARFDYDYIKNDPNMCENNVFYDYNYFKAAPGFSCQETCEHYGQTCESFKFYKNFLEYLSDSYEIIFGGNQDSMEIHGNSVIYGEKEMCSSKKSDYALFCSCFLQI